MKTTTLATLTAVLALNAYAVDINKPETVDVIVQQSAFQTNPGDCQNLVTNQGCPAAVDVAVIAHELTNTNREFLARIMYATATATKLVELSGKIFPQQSRTDVVYQPDPKTEPYITVIAVWVTEGDPANLCPQLPATPQPQPNQPVACLPVVVPSPVDACINTCVKSSNVAQCVISCMDEFYNGGGQ